jgi:hypothetical protein
MIFGNQRRRRKITITVHGGNYRNNKYMPCWRIFITGLFWVYRSIKKDKEEKDKEPRVSV